MKKNIKSALSLIVAALMLLGMVPSAMAADVEAITAAEIERYGTGNSDGRLVEEGMTVSYGDGTDMTRAPYLVDGFHYSIPEILKYSLDLNTSTGEDTFEVYEKSKADTLVGLEKIYETTGTITLTKENNIIEFGWQEKESVSRLELFLHPVCAIKDYEIQYYDGTDWTYHTEGTLDQTQTVIADSNESKATTAYIITFDAVQTTGLRFIVKSFKEEDGSAKIAEAIPRSNDNVNLTEQWILANSGDTYGWLNGIGTTSANGDDAGTNRHSTPYASSYWSSQTSVGNRASGSPQVYPVYPYNRYSGYKITENTSGAFYYAVRFPNSPQSIDKVTLKVSTKSVDGKYVTTGTLKEFEVWCATDLSTNPSGSTSGWTFAGSAHGEFTSEDGTISAYIPQNVSGEYWMIVIKDATEGTQLQDFGFYVLGDDLELFGAGTSLADGCDASVLTDDYYYAAYESSLLTDKTPSANLDKVAKFESKESGIQYLWDTEVTTNRLDLWILSYGGIATYEIQAYDEVNGWKFVQAGEFPKYESALAETATRASYYPVVFEQPVTSKGIRFVIKSFYDEKGAYIAEAKLRSTNNVNLFVHNFYNLETGGNQKGYSPYLWGFGTSLTSRKYNGSGTVNSASTGYAWPYGTASSNPEAFTYVVPDTITTNEARKDFWYSTSFDRSKVKVNKIGINLYKGGISQFKVHIAEECNKGEFHTSDQPILTEQYSGAYEEIATINCNLTQDSDVLFELPKSYPASAILIEVTQYTSDAHIEGFEFYSLPDSEISPVLTDEKATTTALEANNDVTFSIYSFRNAVPNAKVYFALYSGTTLKSVAVKDLALYANDNKTYTVDYTIPENAGENLSVKAYFWDGATLKPLLPAPVETTVAE